MPVSIDIKGHVRARVVIVFSQVIKHKDIKAARALRIHRSLCRGTDPSAESMASGRVAFVLFLKQLGSRDTSDQVRMGK